MTSNNTKAALGSPSITNSQTQPNKHPAYKLLRAAHNDADSTSIFTNKIRNKPLLLTPSHQATTTNQSTAQILASKDKSQRSLRRHIRARKKQYYLQHQKPRPLSAKEKRELKIYDLQPSEIRYEVYRGLNRLWTGYLLEVLGLNEALNTEPTSDTKQSNSSNIHTASTAKQNRAGATNVNSTASSSSKQNLSQQQQKYPPPQSQRIINASNQGSLLASLDYHGMNIHVTQSVDITRVGLEGIIVRETRSTFVVVTSRDKVVKIPKRGSTFRVVVDLDDPFALGGLMTSSGDVDGRDESLVGDTRGGDNENKEGDRSGNRKLIFDLYGSQLEVRPFERAVKKFKWKRI